MALISQYKGISPVSETLQVEQKSSIFDFFKVLKHRY